MKIRLSRPSGGRPPILVDRYEQLVRINKAQLVLGMLPKEIGHMAHVLRLVRDRLSNAYALVNRQATA